MRLLLLLFVLTYFAYGQTRKSENPLAKGFPHDIEWVDWSRATRVAKSRNKPIFFLIHKSWCGACRSLKKEFETDPETPELIELSKKFVMVNVEDDDEPTEKEYKPDGAYIPRLLFLDTNGKHLQTNNVKRFRNHKFFYPLIPEIIDGMKRALIEFESVKRTKREDPANETGDEQNIEEQADSEEETVKEPGKKNVSEEDEDEEDTAEGREAVTFTNKKKGKVDEEEKEEMTEKAEKKKKTIKKVKEEEEDKKKEGDNKEEKKKEVKKKEEKKKEEEKNKMQKDEEKGEKRKDRMAKKVSSSKKTDREDKKDEL